MKKKSLIFLCMTALLLTLLSGCSGTDRQEAPLADGVYTADFDTDSSMFHVNEACDGKGTLTVEEGRMTIHISLASTNIVNLFPGLAKDAQKEGAAILAPSMDTVTYSDGLSEEVCGFDVPVPVLEEEFDLALLGKKGTWYDHKVSVSNPIRTEEGEYTIEVQLEGGSGRASITSPAALRWQDGRAFAQIEWSSPNYDYMKVGDTVFYPINTEGNSVFEIPVSAFDEKITVIADTVAMGTPHEIEYTITFDFASAEKVTGDSAISPSLTGKQRMKLDYAEKFAVDYYDGGYALITISDGGRFLVVPETAELPKGLPEDIVCLQKPVNHIYLAATAVMDMFVSMGAENQIGLSGTKEDGWYIAEAREAMEDGRISYAGKYNMPDYERILSEGCELAIESTMLLHSPEVKEKLENFGIPVLVDRSSYEPHPLGRTEWVKLYGVITGREKEAADAFEEQKAALESVLGEEKTNRRVAFFYITSNGMACVRKSGDYVPKMIELAGGRYVFSELGDGAASSSVNMTMEEFYAAAREADYLIYNSTVDGELHSVDELLQKSPLLKDFTAVSENRVFCTTQNFYQESMSAGTFISDVHAMLMSKEKSNDAFTYLYRLE